MTQALFRKQRGLPEPEPQKSAKKIKTGVALPVGVGGDTLLSSDDDDEDCSYPKDDISQEHTSILHGEIKQSYPPPRPLTKTDLCI